MDVEVSPLSTSEIIVRLADEGIPVCVIARSLKLSADLIREHIRFAIDEGAIVDHPREDWPPGSKRSTRVPDVEGFFGNDEGLYRTCSKYFKTTRQQSLVLGLLLRRPEVTKEQLHHAIERDRSGGKEPTSAKLVDVLVCILRRKLKPFGFTVQTMWGHGYLMHPQDRTRALIALRDFVNDTRAVGAELDDAPPLVPELEVAV
jgi:hypothetical protein